MKILIVEDEIKLAGSLKTSLEHEGYVVDMLHDGEIALSRIIGNKTAYDLAILDVTLPGLDGLSLARNLRKENINIPILMLTARDSKEDIVEGLKSGADDYLIKPFSFDELLARIQALLRRPREVFMDVIETSDIKLNPTTHVVTLHGKEINLTQKEFDILEYLMRHAGQIVSRETLLANVWDFAFNSFSNVIDVHIKNLRKKINTRHEILETIRGAGYKLRQ